MNTNTLEYANIRIHWIIYELENTKYIHRVYMNNYTLEYEGNRIHWST